jgi:hypothetical protein
MGKIALALVALALINPAVARADCAGYLGSGPCSTASGSSFDGLAGLAAGPSGSNTENGPAQPPAPEGTDYGLGLTSSGTGGQANGGPGSACYAGPGGPCYAGPGGNPRACPAGCR